MIPIKINRVLRARKAQIIISVGLLLLASALIFWTLSQPQPSVMANIAEKASFAVIVALVVQWLNVWFTELGPRDDIYSSSSVEYYKAIADARKRIWICQTWLPEVEKDAEKILRVDVSELQMLFASFRYDKKPNGIKSFIFARIAGRKISENEAKFLVKNSVKRFLEKGKKDCLKFNYGPLPGWIAIIDSFVFWGPTPVDADNQSQDIFFHRDHIRGEKGAFWRDQFLVLWKHHSHNYDIEKELYNKNL